MKSNHPVPELLCPAGSEEALHAAVDSGADAVYLGSKAFGARASAVNFDDETLARAVEYAHLHHARVHVTVNTLVKEKEFGRPCGPSPPPEPTRSLFRIWAWRRWCGTSFLR